MTGCATSNFLLWRFKFRSFVDCEKSKFSFLYINVYLLLSRKLKVSFDERTHASVTQIFCSPHHAVGTLNLCRYWLCSLSLYLECEGLKTNEIVDGTTIDQFRGCNIIASGGLYIGHIADFK